MSIWLFHTSLEDETKILGWFVENFGSEDTHTLFDWVWGRERDPERYVKALWRIAQEVTDLRDTGDPNHKDIVFNLLELARMPKEMKEALDDISNYIQPIYEKLKTRAIGHRNDRKVVEECLEELRHKLREKIRLMFPFKHRAFIDGALYTACKQHQGSGRVILDYHALVRALFEEDPLKTTAKASHF